jgi:nucleoid-associated protein YgaU
VAAPAPAVVASVPVPELHVIAAGENLWTIAAAHVAMLTNRSAGAAPAAEVVPYWRALCDLNRATIRSGNPSLVYPGEVLRLPPA